MKKLSSFLSCLMAFAVLLGVSPFAFGGQYDYTAYRTGDIAVDGLLSESGWQAAPKSPSFVDLENGEPGWFESYAAILWDDAYLYIGFWFAEPDISAFLRNRDDRVYLDNDAEVFIDGGDCYYEFEINAYGTVYEVFWIWDDAMGSPAFRRSEFDAARQRVLKLDGIGAHKHPRGMRTGFLDWDLPGIQWGVNVDGTVNVGSDTDNGWTVEIAIPWRSLSLLAGARALPPENGDMWRIDCSRFQQRGKDGRKLERPAGWAWKTHGAFDSHMPEMFPRIRFSTRSVEEAR